MRRLAFLLRSDVYGKLFRCKRHVTCNHPTPLQQSTPSSRRAWAVGTNADTNAGKNVIIKQKQSSLHLSSSCRERGELWLYVFAVFITTPAMEPVVLIPSTAKEVISSIKRHAFDSTLRFRSLYVATHSLAAKGS